MKLELDPAALTSPGRAISERARWETALNALVDKHMIRFLKVVTENVLSQKDVSPTEIQNDYADAVAALLEELDVPYDAYLVIEAELAESELPVEVYETAEYLLTEAQELNLSDADTKALMIAGMDYDNPSFAEDSALQASAVPRLIGQALANATGRGRRWRNRAKDTSRTAATGALNETQARVLQRSSLTHKQWVTRRDDQVRPTHAAADGQTIPKASLFQVGAAALSFPGQGTFPPEEIYGCRCVMIGVTADGKTH